MVKDMPASTRDMGLIPDPGESHMPRATKPMHYNNSVCVPQQKRETDSQIDDIKAMVCVLGQRGEHRDLQRKGNFEGKLWDEKLCLDHQNN